jgi:hypothetical protein
MISVPVVVLGIVCLFQFTLNVWTAIRMVDMIDDMEEIQERCDILEDKADIQADINKIPI